MERVFDRFAELSALDPAAFGAIGSDVGMDIVGLPLSAQP
jgi:hypothetical protein